MQSNQQKLKQLRDKHGLHYKQIAEITGYSWWAVKSWFLHSGSKAARGVSDETIDKLESSLTDEVYEPWQDEYERRDCQD